ncbi:MAG: RHS repeat-associated core domain-containing protein [Chitinophagaceae bacterium]
METTGWELFDTDPLTGTGGGIVGGWERGRVQFELSNHLGNVLMTISDIRIPVLVPEGIEVCDDPVHPACYRPIDYYLPQVLTANDYYPFGMGMPGRKFAEGEYRYGFNGKEKDSDINSLTAYDYGFRIYNPAIGRFLSVDPLSESFPWFSPYQFAGNSPITFIDLDGQEMSWRNPVTGEVVPAGPVSLPVGSRNSNGWILYNPMVKPKAPTIYQQVSAYQPQLSKGSDNLAAVQSTNIARTSIKKPRQIANSPRVVSVSADNRNEYEKSVSAAYARQAETTNRLRGATIDPLAGAIVMNTAHAGSEYVKQTVSHGVGIYEGIQDGNGWKIAGNTLGLALNVSPIVGLKTASTLTAAERGIVNEANKILAASELQVLKNAHQSGTFAEVTIGGRRVLFEPDLPSSGFTLMGENGFVLGNEAFQSSGELGKTLLQELYRLKNSAVPKFGLTGAQSSTETNAAFQFAERAASYLKIN